MLDDHRIDVASPTDIDALVSGFGHAVTPRLRTAEGSPESHLRGPFETLLESVAARLGLGIATLGEVSLGDLSIRPDYAVDVDGARVGYVELKRPGRGVPDTWSSPNAHDQRQWQRLQLLPNVLYSDGQEFALYHYGTRHGDVARLAPSLDRAGSRLACVGGAFRKVIKDFLEWEPETPRTLDSLVTLTANLCRFLREDVESTMQRERSAQTATRTFSALADDWRRALFPDLTDEAFADQYSQTVTFALLLARVKGISFVDRSIVDIARLLGKKHSLMGRALAVLTDQSDDELSVALTTMIRVLGVVDWSDFPEDTYATLYEDFLTAYDPVLRRASGVYYTPSSMVSSMVRFVDAVLRTRLDRCSGFAERGVVVVDPAMGTGSFLAEVIDVAAATVSEEQGPGAVPAYLHGLSDRLIGFENQAAPYAVAQLRIHTLLRAQHRSEAPHTERRFLADALGDPGISPLQSLGKMYQAITESREGANEVKSRTPVMVVIGNPPFKDKAKGTAPWIEARGGRSAPSLSEFRSPGNGRFEYVLSNKYVYFWRWATWKVFDFHPKAPDGIVAFVCSAGFTTGRGFIGMREYLRRNTDEGWIIDLSPEGHQPPMDTRFFRGNQQPICIAVFVRRGAARLDVPAVVRYTSIAGAVDRKAAHLAALTPDGPGWEPCDTGWTAPFRPASTDVWSRMPETTDLFAWTAPGVKPNRTWVYAPTRDVLRQRWDVLIAAPVEKKRTLLKETSTTRIDSRPPTLPGEATRRSTLALEKEPCPDPVRVGYRSFDRQWTIPDARVLDRPRPMLWNARSDRQIHIVEHHGHPLQAGPALVFSALIPDMDFFRGNHGGRVLPLYRDADAHESNLVPGLIPILCHRLGVNVTPTDVVAYLAAMTSHPAYTRRLRESTVRVGVRVPITTSVELWRRAVEIGREVVWLHTFGERCTDRKAGRPAGSPRLASDRPRVITAIPHTTENMPERIDHRDGVLVVGDGRVGPVSVEVWNYEVSGMRVVKHWFGYRKKRPTGNRGSELNQIVASTWNSEMTTELLDLLHVLARCVALEPRQHALLDDILAEPLLTVDDLSAHGVRPVTPVARAIPQPRGEAGLFSGVEL